MTAMKPNTGVLTSPPVIFTLCLIGGLLGGFAHDAVDYHPEVKLPWQISWPIGLLNLGLALFVIRAGFNRLRDFGVSVRPDRPAAQLVTGGIFRITRNPMYIGMVHVLVSIGLALSSGDMMIAAWIMFAYLNWRVIPREEAYLTATFGDEYRAYCAHVRRWWGTQKT